MQPGGVGTVQCQSTKQDHTGNIVFGLGHASPGKVIVNKPLGNKSSQQPLYYPVFEVQVHNAVVNNARVFKYDRANR